MKKYLSLKNICAIAIFGALAAILYCVPGLQFNLPFVAPGFMSIHLDDIPSLVAGLSYGPFVGCSVIVLKTLIKLPMTSTFCAGEIGDLMYSLALILPASIIYNKNRTFKNAVIGLSIGFVLNMIFSTIINLYTIFPLYMKVYHMPEGSIAGTFKAIFNVNIKSDLDPIISILLIPFNLIKNVIVIAATLMIYKPLQFLINKNK